MATAADKNITIKFIADGDKDLIDAFKQLATAQAKYNKESKTTTSSAKKVNASFQTLALQVKNTVGSFKKLNVSQATINKAMNGNRVAIDKVRQAMKRLDVQQGKTRKGARLLDNAFATLRSKMLLFQFAMALGIRQLIGFVQESAKIESMSRAFITLSGEAESSSFAMEKLQKATNGTMSQFDLLQQANNAMVLGVSKNSSEMAEMFDIAQRLGRALGRDTASSVESLITGIGRQSRLMLDNIGIIVKSDEAYREYANKIGTTVDKLTDADKKTAFLQATMESARQKVALLGKEVNTSQDSFDRLATSVSNATIAIGTTFKSAIAAVIDAFLLEEESAKNNADAIDDTMKSHNLLFKSSNFLSGGMKNLQKSMNNNTESVRDNTNANIELGLSMEFVDSVGKKRDEENRARVLKTFAMIEKRQKARIRNELGLQESQEKAKAKDIEFSQGLTQRSKMIAQAQKQTSEDYKTGLISEQEAMERYKDRVKVIDATILKSKANSVSGMINAFSGLNDAMGGSARASARLAQISAAIDMYAGANKAFAQGGVFGFVTGAAIIAQGLGNIAQISKGIDKFETGGLVGGRRHSQGGTLIEAEQGEFVMSRNAVQAVGIEAMNRINQGGGAGSVVINVSGNVMSQDYVEGELADQLKTAIRRGADIGVS
jgi:hypothetical protein